MFGKLMPENTQFFDMFQKHADLCVEGAKQLLDLMKNFSLVEQNMYSIEKIEKQADKITDDTVVMLHKTFITPLNRDDIHRLITHMDDILDLIEDSAQTVHLYDIKQTNPDAIRLGELIVKCTEKMHEAINLLPDMKNASRITEICSEIDRLESDADHAMHSALSRLFREEPDVRNLIKLKTLYEFLESVTDSCEEVANIIEGIAIENA